MVLFPQEQIKLWLQRHQDFSQSCQLSEVRVIEEYHTVYHTVRSGQVSGVRRSPRMGICQESEGR
jgi:hypothetical protein